MLPYPDIQTYLLSPQLRALSHDLMGGLTVLHPPGNFSDFFSRLSLSCLKPGLPVAGVDMLHIADWV